MVVAAMAKLQIWRDRRGQISPLRIAALALLLLPLALAAWNAEAIAAGARPVNDLIHRAGFWALMLLIITLAVTPLRRITRFGQLVDIRRMLGVGVFCYAALHISLYVVDQMFDFGKVASEIVHRVYLVIGFTALTGLAVLAATSTDGMVRRLGGSRWQRLHQIVYVIAFLALIHYFQQTKADVSAPTLVAGLLAWLMCYRIVVRRIRGELSSAGIAVLSVVVAALTLLAQSIAVALVFQVSPLVVLQTAFTFYFDFDLESLADTLESLVANLQMLNPAWLVLAAGLIVAALNMVFARFAKPRRVRAKPDDAPRSWIERTLVSAN
jgi:methionine sulfoxide reductase heme-binding subunit